MESLATILWFSILAGILVTETRADDAVLGIYWRIKAASVRAMWPICWVALMRIAGVV